MSNNNVWLSGSLDTDKKKTIPPELEVSFGKNSIQAWVRTGRLIFGEHHPVILGKGAARIFRRDYVAFANNPLVSLTGSLVSYRDSVFVIGKRITLQDVTKRINQVWLQGL
ncbi:MAG: hypothetical protein U9Q82_10715, partial [Chloroflexota bacterium]|nr:hypothetical protein [Chloroflexota bacterium]